jgi:hypothetical protein
MGRTTCHALCAGPFAAAAFTDAASGVGKRAAMIGLQGDGQDRLLSTPSCPLDCDPLLYLQYSARFPTATCLSYVPMRVVARGHIG